MQTVYIRNFYVYNESRIWRKEKKDEICFSSGFQT